MTAKPRGEATGDLGDQCSYQPPKTKPEDKTGAPREHDDEKADAGAGRTEKRTTEQER